MTQAFTSKYSSFSQLEHGTAEIFGAEMTPYYWYKIPKMYSMAAYTWGSCTLKITVRKINSSTTKKKNPNSTNTLGNPKKTIATTTLLIVFV